MATTGEVTPGLDSAFYLFEKRLMDSGYIRHPGETLAKWLIGIESTGGLFIPAESLRSILALHYRYRFDPESITLSERAKLKTLVQAWLDDCS